MADDGLKAALETAEKARLVKHVPIEVVRLLPDLCAALKRAGWSPVTMLHMLLDYARKTAIGQAAPPSEAKAKRVE